MNTQIQELKATNKSKRNNRIAKIKLEITKNQGIKRRNLDKSEFKNIRFSASDSEIIQRQKQSSQRELVIDDKSQQFDGYFDEKFQVLNKIGEGANGPVFKCQYRETKKMYAVKYIRVDEERKRELKKHFIFMKELSHKNIMKEKALYINEKKRLAYLVLEYLPFKTLDQIIIKDEGQFKQIVRQLLSALKYIHQKNICHRDIKPENILYDSFTKTIKLIDFDNAKKTYSRGQRRDMLTVNGTYHYLAPEVFEGGGYNEKVDLWALGVTIFKLVSGRCPFESEYVGETVDKIKNGSFSFEEEKWKLWSLSLRNFVRSLIQNSYSRISLIEAIQHRWLNNPLQLLQEYQQSSKSRKQRNTISYQSKEFLQNSASSIPENELQRKFSDQSSLKKTNDSEKSKKTKRKRSESIDSSLSKSISKAQIKEQKAKEENASARSQKGSFLTDHQDRQSFSPEKLSFPKRLKYATSSCYQVMEDEQFCTQSSPSIYERKEKKQMTQKEIENPKFPDIQSFLSEI